MPFGLDLPPQFRVFGAFFLHSFAVGSLYPRLPDIQRAMGVAEGGLGLALTGIAVGTLLSLTFAGPLLERVGHRRALLMLIPLQSAILALSTMATGPLAFFLMLVPAGLCIGAVEVVVNLEADRVEHQIGHRIMSRAHAFWSIGFFTAGLLGAFAGQAGLSPALHLLAMLPAVLLGTALILGRFQAAPGRSGGSAAKPPRLALPTWPILVLVLATLSAMLLEGAGADWSAIYMRDEFQTAPFIAGLAVALGAGTQAVTRFFADAVIERFSPVVVARIMLAILLAGALMVFFATAQWVALAGFAVMGVGTSAIFPLAMSAAAQRTDRPAALNVAALAQTSFVVFLLGPPLLGIVAEAYGIRWSFGICLPLIALSFVCVGAFGRKPIRHDVPA